jgi:4-amino-4-deoxy-L-arabinose transferase-like glycosyltransferase
VDSTRISPRASRAKGSLSAAELGILLLVVSVAVGRVASTYRVVSETFDEPAHIAAGMEWLDRGTFTYNRMHPPLSRVPIALGPWLDGARATGAPDAFREGDGILHAGGDYYRTLALARMGVLPFLVLAICATWSLARRLYGPVPGLMAATGFSLLPPVLAHGGLATTDMAITAFMPVVVLAGLRWLELPTGAATFWLGAAIGVAILLKFSALAFVPAALAAMLVAKLTVEPGTSHQRLRRWRSLELPTLALLVIVVSVVWAGYGFSVGWPDETMLVRLLPARLAHSLVLPAPEFFDGLLTLFLYSDGNYPSYALGRVQMGGPWYFFPLAIAVKTPLAFLALALIGLVLTVRETWRQRAWQLAVPAAVAAALLTVAATSGLAISLRHLLPVYPFLAALGGAGALSLWHVPRHPRRVRVFCGLLVGWLVLASVRAHPDYLASFNELAAGRPEQFLVNGDLDWGQDVGRLSDTVRARGIDSLTVYLFGWHDRRLLASPKHLSAPAWDPPPPPVDGWVAASAFPLYVIPRLEWLLDHRPVARIGKSIQLFYLPPSGR